MHGVDAGDQVTVRIRLVRNRLLKFLGKVPPCLVGLEACGAAHYWARKIEQLGHRVKLMSPRLATQLELDGEVIPEPIVVPLPDGGV